MKLTFHIDYRTNWGEELFVVGTPLALGENDYANALALNPEYPGAETWVATIELPDGVGAFNYRYFVRNEYGDIKNEWGHGNVFTPGNKIRQYDIYDRWQDMPDDKAYYSAVFTECICRHPHGTALEPKAGMVTFGVAAPLVPASCVVALTGASDQLGNWNPSKALRMAGDQAPVWKVNVPAKGLSADTEYKFILIDVATGDVVSWEGGENRRVGVNPELNSATIIEGLRLNNTMPDWKGAGTAIPVFSLRSDEDFGVGDFADIRKVVDWLVETGQTFLQLLPINDTTMTHTWTDSYPYNANSTFALHPMYLRLSEIGKLKDKKRQKYYDTLGRELNALPEIDYERVNNGKIEYFHEIFAQDGEATLNSGEYKSFLAANQYWLLPYAAFCTLRDKFHTPDFSKWGEYSEYSAEVLSDVVAKYPDEINYNCFLQYHLDKQMRAAHEYANSHGIALKGDIPIGISRTSADAWQDPRLFNMDCQAGAPPDDFSVLGQNWGFPTYNWEEMNRDGFAWWKARFRKMAQYFDAYRIDHVLGFFRIWQIPMDAIHGLLGVFSPAMPFSVDELRNDYDFWLDVNLHTTPYIMEYFLTDFFGPYTADAHAYFDEIGYGRYKLKAEFNTQRKIAEHFATFPADERNTRLCDGLIGLVDQVLFIEDPEEKGKYHPRISAQFTYTYRSLNDYERWCFDRLYNDFYYRRHNDFWYGKAMWKLPPLIDSTDMLVCAEDLGMIPACVPAVMQQLQILSLEIQRMPKDPNSAFGNTWQYPVYSVCTTSTHDMSGIRQWWEEDRDKTQQFFNNVLHDGGVAPYFAEPWVCEKIVDQHLYSPSMLCILPLQDWLSIDGDVRRENPADERINVPANSRHYWRYRMHLSLDELASLKDLNAKILAKVKNSQR